MLALNILLFGCIVVILIISTAILLTVTAIDRVTAILLKRSDSCQFSQFESLAKAFMDHDSTSGEKNSRQDAQDQQDSPESSRFSPGQTVFAKERMEWMYGNSCDVPKGAKIVLEAVAQTSHGWRYSGRWKNVYLSSIPEGSLESVDVSREQEKGSGSSHQTPDSPLPPGGDVWPVDLDSGAVEFAWDFRDMNHNTLESGTEATQEAARQMVQAAYEKHIAYQTREIERVEQPV